MHGITIECGSRQCTATAKVISSRFINLGNAAGYESHLALVEVPHISDYMLTRVLSRIPASGTQRLQVANA